MNAPFCLEKSERLFSSAVGCNEQSAQTEHRCNFGRLGDRERHIGTCRTKYCLPRKAVRHAVKHSPFNVASGFICYHVFKHRRINIDKRLHRNGIKLELQCKRTVALAKLSAKYELVECGVGGDIEKQSSAVESSAAEARYSYIGRG